MQTTEKIRLDESHIYWLGQERIPGYSEIMKSAGIGINPFWTDSGRDLGTALHQWVLFLAQGQEPEDAPDERIAGRVAAFRRFIEESGFKFAGGEEPQYEPNLRYACTPDLWGHIGSFSCVIDVKSGAKELSHSAQTAAQKLALAANGFRAQKRYALYLKDDKTYRLCEHMDSVDESRWRAIVTAHHAKQWYCQ